MSGETNDPSVREQRVDEAIAAYLEAVDAGEAPDPKEFIAAHSDIAAELEAFFANRDEFERMAETIQPAGAAAPKAQPDDMTLRPAGEPTEVPTLRPTETAGVAIGTMVRYFGDYELLEEIARGGMGVVYKARQVSLNRIVALKMILAGQSAWGDRVQRAISPDSKLLAVANKVVEFDTPGATGGGGRPRGHGLEVRDLTTNQRLWRQTEPIEDPIECIAFSPDAKLIATGEDLWRATTGDKLNQHRFPGGTRAYTTSPQCVVFSPDSSLVFVGETISGQIVVGDVEDRRKPEIWKGHQGTVFSLAIHPNGNLLASGGEDRTIRLWDVPTGREVAKWEAHDVSVTALAFSPDGATLVSGSADSTVKLWNLPFIRKELAALGLDW